MGFWIGRSCDLKKEIHYSLRIFFLQIYQILQVRRALGDFGVPISIVLMVILDVIAQDTYTDKLQMPDGISPTNPAVRGW